jgi:predicted kinase
MLVVVSGLPGVGKTTIARDLAVSMNALHLRIDSIEQALRNAGRKVEGEGYSGRAGLSSLGWRTTRYRYGSIGRATESSGDSVGTGELKYKLWRPQRESEPV